MAISVGKRHLQEQEERNERKKNRKSVLKVEKQRIHTINFIWTNMQCDVIKINEIAINLSI